MAEKTCFVIMGFGKKTDYGKRARTLDLDATYKAIIKPAVTACGHRCIRADEVTHSGIIDKPMYEMLLRADLVIADISTANPNALYELGVRHALRPHSTILIKEMDGAFHFDLNHLATLQYKHLGEDIGAAEAAAKSEALAKLIRGVLAKPDIDSPVFTFLKQLKGPALSDEQIADRLGEAEKHGAALADNLADGRAAAASSDHAKARDCFLRAAKLLEAQKGPIQAPDPFVIQQLALATYKAKEPNALSALLYAWQIILQLTPDTSTDPETLGIAGAIQRRLWEQNKDLQHLDKAVELYGRGFEVRRDYYNGENYALCLDLRSRHQTLPEEALYDRQTAAKVRQRVIAGLKPVLSDSTAIERSDYRWMLATMANTLFAIGRAQEAEVFEQQFRAVVAAQWEVETFEAGKLYALQVSTSS